ncbi:MAG: hypothetical protein MUF58_12660 [Arcicella sp.]|nr:hypothetical protein [Arcicella sp.]
MKNLLLLFLLWSSITIKAQSTSETLTISGVVQKSLTLKIDDLNKMKIVERKDFKVVSTSGDIRKEFKTYKAVLLKDLLEIATINLQNPKEKGKLYVVATATDGYNAIFSYHEIFNNPVGDNILVVFEVNGNFYDG